MVSNFDFPGYDYFASQTSRTICPKTLSTNCGSVKIAYLCAGSHGFYMSTYYLMYHSMLTSKYQQASLQAQNYYTQSYTTVAAPSVCIMYIHQVLCYRIPPLQKKRWVENCGSPWTEIPLTIQHVSDCWTYDTDISPPHRLLHEGISSHPKSTLSLLNNRFVVHPQHFGRGFGTSV